MRLHKIKMVLIRCAFRVFSVSAALRLARRFNMEKTAVTFLTEYRAGTIGRISLETPLSRKAMIEALVAKPAETATEEEPTEE